MAAAEAAGRRGGALGRPPAPVPVPVGDLLPAGELVRPSVTELSQVRTNILCTVPGCGKVLPNSPALNMHLSKAHPVQDGKLNAPVRKGLKTSQKFYCCPIEGCPRGPNRPFSQFSLVKQHFMKMHAEKKHKCDKCSNSYGTEWYLKRHIEVCGKTFQCTCGCPYASRTALLSHIYRTGHEIPAEHRDPPSKKRKMETSIHNQQLAEKANEAFINTHNNNPGTQELESSEVKLAASLEGSCSSNLTNQMQPKCTPKMLLPKPKLALVKLPVMQLAHLPIYISATDSSVKPAVVAVDNQGSLNFVPAATWTPNSSVSSCSQTDLSFSSQVSLPISVQTQTLLPASKLTSSIAAQTDAFSQVCFPTCGISRETQTSRTQDSIDGRVQMDQAVMCSDIFDNVDSSYSVSTHIELTENNLMPANIDQALLQRSNCKSLNQDTVKSESLINFSTQPNILPTQNTMDNQTQTMDLLSDLENIFSGNMPGQTLDNRGLLSETSSNADTHLPSGSSQSTGIDFDIEEFFSASNIQTQTEESELGTLNPEPVLESLDIETQTDFLFSDSATQSYSCRGNSNFLGLEMFDTQTQTDLNFFLDSNTHLPLGSILKQSSFSMSTDSSDTETQTEVYPATKNTPTQNIESKVQLSSAETQTMDSCFENLGSLFLTSNETQTAMDDFLLADLAWNTMESQFSSVETQTCEELCSLFQSSDKPSH
ncbi:ATM interactor isoform X2 [Strigops habroptila]|uniref:ATM interactor isoform X2 n=1 Tax=Strigops habroptila TaxID=2489341 RepID=UPI0011D01DE7|nr:ATM interactor isoform X2 [Strigops habroptila]